MRIAGMLTVRDVLGPGGFAEAVLPRFEVREGQLEMAEAILDRLLEGGVLAVEAPTGVGKTLAYLVPAILSKRKRVLVSTNTKTLQDQIIDKDLPLLTRVLERAGVKLRRASADEPPLLIPREDEVRFALMKGRSNYLCLDRLDRRTRQMALQLDLGERGTPDVLLEDLVSWSKRTKTGDRAELASMSERSPIWSELDARSEICTGMRCSRYDDCFVVKMRREAQNAELVIVNHHLLLADLALKAEAQLTRDGKMFGEVIPPAEALILDEAHSLEETASDYFGGRVSSRKIESLSRDISAYLGESKRSIALDLELARAMTEAESVFRELPQSDGRFRIRSSSSDGAESDAERDRALAEAREAKKRAAAALSALADSISIESGGDLVAEALARRTIELRDSIAFVLDAADPDYVYWTERQGNAASLGASPINVARILARHFYPRFGAVVMTSATLAAGDTGCRYFLESVGAPGDTYEMVLGSPFDYPAQAALYLPNDAPDPDAPNAVLAMVRIAKQAIDLVGGGALFLFTSHRAMRLVHAQLRLALEFPVLIQGERPQRELLRMFIERAPSVLFATASFWEGVDVPGDPLRLVLIDRLPFGSPADPLAAARAERIEADGESAFNRFFLPRAILRLKQGFGRLIRGKADRGVVAILDRRVQTRGYGKRFVRALPDATRVHDVDALREWLGAPHALTSCDIGTGGIGLIDGNDAR
jgi:ATP-dependent DNA helicase DinG